MRRVGTNLQHQITMSDKNGVSFYSLYETKLWRRRGEDFLVREEFILVRELGGLTSTRKEKKKNSTKNLKVQHQITKIKYKHNTIYTQKHLRNEANWFIVLYFMEVKPRLLSLCYCKNTKMWQELLHCCPYTDAHIYVQYIYTYICT